MAFPVLDRVLQQVAASGLVGSALGIVWHAGEPTALPRTWYEDAFGYVENRLNGVRITHHFQTNAVLIDAAWCAFFHKHRVRVGVSVDGPAALHDRYRQTRDGRGSHARVMQGVDQLRAAAVQFHAICVLTNASFGQADAIFDFFAKLGSEQVGFNVEEIEAAHEDSSLQCEGAEAALRAFWVKFIARLGQMPTAMRVREVETVLAALRDPGYGTRTDNSQNRAGSILSVSVDGRYSFWSPELLGVRHRARGEVVLGNLATDESPWKHLGVAAAWQAEITAGVRACEQQCAYFRLCLGGAPANKLAEHGSMNCTETLACRFGLQVPVDVVLHALEQHLLV